jgi:hypothetical protein
LTEPREGKVNITARAFGLLKVNVSLLEKINTIEDVVLATLHDNTVCRPQTIVAGTKIIPLYTVEARVREVEGLCQMHGKVLELLLFKKKRVGIVITGNEVYSGRVEDGFTNVIQKKLEPFGLTIDYRLMAPDDANLIAKAIQELREKGSELILACGGMSVDPDDVTREGIEKAGVDLMIYGAPIIPGTMFLYAKWDDITVLGLPACVIHDPSTAFDILLPRVLADEFISAEDIASLGHGGLCLRCETCDYPVCPFGKY